MSASPPASGHQPRSGRLLLRMPISLHEDLWEAAKADRVTLNQFICYVLAGAVSWRQAGSEPADARQNHQRPARDPVAEMWRDLLR
jgi:hypothetical protein